MAYGMEDRGIVAMIRLVLSNTIKIFGLSKAQKEAIKKKLRLPNPLYHKLLRMHSRAIYGCPKEFVYYKETLEYLEVPRGLRKRLLHFLEVCKEESHVEEYFIYKKL